jgi:hypothetical protein
MPWVMRLVDLLVAGLEADGLDLPEVVDLLGEALCVAGERRHLERPEACPRIICRPLDDGRRAAVLDAAGALGAERE